MSKSYIDEPMLEAFVYETAQIVESLEQVMIESEKNGAFEKDAVNEIFRFMHTIKGSSAMMMFNNLSELSHHLEDVFFVIREDPEVEYDVTLLIDIILESIDYFKIELMKIRDGSTPDGDHSSLVDQVKNYLEKIKTDKKIEKPPATATPKYYIRPSKTDQQSKYYRAKIWFKKGSEMENIRAYTIINNIAELAEEVHYAPRDIIERDESILDIRTNGFLVMLKSSHPQEEVKSYFDQTIFLEELEFSEISKEQYQQFEKSYEDQFDTEEIRIPKTSKKYVEKQQKQEPTLGAKQSIISVNVDKLDKLMDMVGEMVIAEAMVTQNPEIRSLEIESFDKASRQLHKITGELQDLVMAIRMVPLSTTFMKMHRIVRDMTRKLGKHVDLEVIGEETEVDKNIIEKIADPLMHIIRNAIDHGIEEEEERIARDKPKEGKILLEAKNSGSDVLIIIKDDGKGLDKKKLYEKALLQGLVEKEFEDMSDRELYQLILHPGFSTNDEVTEYSGRGVGMDVVSKNIQSIGGTVLVDSIPDKGTSIILKIPLTLAIIEGMNIKVGNSRFTLPIVAIKESFRPQNNEIFRDTEGQEMIMVRGLCYPIVRLHEFYKIEQAENNFERGILIMVEEDERACCIFADELLGQQQVVVKGLPEYVKKYKNIEGLGGCTLLGDGSISLILDVGQLNLSNVYEKIKV